MGLRKDVKDVDNGKIGSFIRALRKEKGMTQMDLAEALHITDRAVSKWERGLNAPDIALLEPLAELLEVTVGELIRGERAPEGSAEDRPDETRDLLDYSKGEVERKMGTIRKKYLALLAGCLALAAVIGGALLWRSGVLFLLDRKPSPDGESVVRVYSKEWSTGPLRFTTRDMVQLIQERGEETTYVAYGNSAYDGLSWAPDGQKYVFSYLRDGRRWTQLAWLDRHSEWSLDPILNIGCYLEDQGALEPGAAARIGDGVEYQFLQWGKDGSAMLFYYAFDWEGLREGYFWYNCTTGQVSGIVEL